MNEQPQQAPSYATITNFAETWPSLSVDARRDVASTLLTAVRVHQDKSVELIPRWSAPVTIHFTKRNRVPLMPDGVYAGV